MTAQDKSLIYTLLKKTVSFECGYTPAVFASDSPAFQDDTQSTQAEPVSQNVLTMPAMQSTPSSTLNVSDSRMSAALQASSLIAKQQAEPVSQSQPVSQAQSSEISPQGEADTGSFSKGERSEEKSSIDNFDNFSTLEDIAAAVKNCRACRLAENRTNTVFGEGVTNPLVLVVGEGPGHDEDVTGRPFVGAAGQLLDKMLAAIQLSRNKNCYIANIVKCRPPNNRTPENDECTICRKYLDAQIKLLKPTMILAMGNTAMQSLLGQSGITKLHGIFFNMNGIPVMPTFHPSALLRDVTKKRDAWEDLKLFRRRLIAFVGQYSQRLS